jgi:hypothetical protein
MLTFDQAYDIACFVIGALAALGTYVGTMRAQGKTPFSIKKIDDGRKLIQNQKEIIAAQVETCAPVQEITAITDNIDISKLAVIIPIAIKYGEEGYSQEEGLKLLQMLIGATKNKQEQMNGNNI